MGSSSALASKGTMTKGFLTFYLAEKTGSTLANNLFKKRILYEGKFVHPGDPKKWMLITPEHLRDAVRNFNAGAMDRVQLYFTHQEDPRNLAGQVVGLEEGIDAADGKNSLYALIKPESPAAAELMEKNAVGVSAKIDHWYREHLGGRDLGLVVKHVAMVGEGWIKKLGEFIPLPQMVQASVQLAELQEHQGAIIYLEEETEETDETGLAAHITLSDQCGTELLAELDAAARKKIPDEQYGYIEPNCPPGQLSCRHFPIHDESHVRNALARMSQSEFGSKAKGKIMAAAHKFGIKVGEEAKNSEGMSNVTKDELTAAAKEHGFVLMTEAEHTQLRGKAAIVDSVRTEFKFSESDDVVAGLVKEINGPKEQLATVFAEREVDKLLTENKITPAQKPSLVALYKQAKPLYDQFVATLKPNSAVKLGEEGGNEGVDPGTGKIDTAEETKRGLKAMYESGIPLSEDALALIGEGPKAVASKNGK